MLCLQHPPILLPPLISIQTLLVWLDVGSLLFLNNFVESTAIWNVVRPISQLHLQIQQLFLLLTQFLILLEIFLSMFFQFRGC